MSQTPVKNHQYVSVRGLGAPGAHIIAVGGGKGGVGKSFVSSNLAIFLANMGFNTIIVDLDLGAANLHTSLGEGLPPKGLIDLVDNAHLKLSDVAIGTRFPRLRLVSGANDTLDMANSTIDVLSKIMSSIYEQKADYIILDLSAGTHSTTLDFFLMAQSNLITTTPEPSSVENAYRFMKACFYRRIRRYEKQLHLGQEIREIMDHSADYGIKSPSDLLKTIGEKNEISGKKLKNVMEALQFDLVLNQIRTSKDAELGSSMATISRRYFGVPSQFLGAIEYDNAVWQSLRKQKPLLLEYPHSRLYNQILRIARNIARPQAKKIVV